MKVQVEAKPLHEPLAGGTPGATVRSSRSSPGTHAVAVDPGDDRAAASDPEAARALSPASRRSTVPCPAFLIRHPSAGRDPRRHRPAPLGRHRRARELRPPRRPHRQARPRARRRRPGPAPRARPRPGRDTGRRDDPPALRPHLGDLRVPAGDLRRQRGRVGGRHRRRPRRSSTATAAPTTTTPSTTGRSTSTAAASTPTRPSGAPSTSSATAASASPTRPATAPATCR